MHRAVFNEMNKRFTTFPFTLRALEDEKTARLGVVELLTHDLVHPYPVRLCVWYERTDGWMEVDVRVCVAPGP